MKDAFEKKNLIGIVKTRVTKMTIYGKWGGGGVGGVVQFYVYTVHSGKYNWTVEYEVDIKVLWLKKSILFKP